MSWPKLPPCCVLLCCVCPVCDVSRFPPILLSKLANVNFVCAFSPIGYAIGSLCYPIRAADVRERESYSIKSVSSSPPPPSLPPQRSRPTFIRASSGQSLISFNCPTCGQLGHIAQNCNKRGTNVRWHYCSRRGHRVDSCFVKAVEKRQEILLRRVVAEVRRPGSYYVSPSPGFLHLQTQAPLQLWGQIVSWQWTPSYRILRIHSGPQLN